MSLSDICACITAATDLALARAVADRVSLYEVRIDLIGEGWLEVAAELPHPWIACNRLVSQGGKCVCLEDERLAALDRAVASGASWVDIELCSPDAGAVISGMRGRARVIVSHHDLMGTPDEDSLAQIVHHQMSMGADVCKVVTTARRADDVATVLQLARRFAGRGIVTFAMGSLGLASRVLAPLSGAEFTYAALTPGHESAPGQCTVQTLCDIYGALERPC